MEVLVLKGTGDLLTVGDIRKIADVLWINDKVDDLLTVVVFVPY